MKSAFFTLIILTITLNCVAQQKTTALTPDVVVRNLYKVHKAGSGPFFQTKKRALVDKYFSKEFANLIWKDAVKSAADQGVGVIDFDPLYNAQDVEITGFKVEKPMYGEGNLNLADVPVTFKNMGTKQTVLIRVEKDKSKIWKISDIFYPENDDSSSSLKGLLKEGLK